MQALIIDDSRAMRRILKMIVTQLGFETIEAENGREGLNQLRQFPETELVLVDWNMPEMNGLEFIEIIRSNPNYDELKLVMVTTETEPTPHGPRADGRCRRICHEAIYVRDSRRKASVNRSHGPAGLR